MTTDDKIRVEKSQHDINREPAKISVLLSGKTDKRQYVTHEEILSHSNQRQIIEQAKFAYFPLGKAFEKQTENQVGTIKSLKPFNKKDEWKQIDGVFPENLMNDLIRDKLKKIGNLQDIIKKDDICYR